MVQWAAAILAVGAAAYVATLFRRFRWRAFALLGAQLAVLLVVAAAVEVGGRAWASFRPSYRVLFLEPDRDLGWTLAPGLRFTWTGGHGYAPDFSVPVAVNSRGFRDLERDERKDPGVVRVALLGDSFVEALQVPFEKTAGQLLESRLAQAVPGRRFEVLNFGVSSYGVGQCLLAWERHARRFAPDYVFVAVAAMHFQRTVTAHEGGALPRTAGLSLAVRPTFSLHRGALFREPARDFDSFVQVQRQIMREEFGGGRLGRRPAPSFLAYHTRRVWERLSAPHDEGEGAPLPRSAWGGLDPKTVQVNLVVLEELGRGVRAHGGELAVVDFVLFLDRRATKLSEALRRVSRDGGFGYVDLSLYLRSAARGGARTTWIHDGHFNETGHQAFAEALFGYLASRPLAGART